MTIVKCETVGGRHVTLTPSVGGPCSKFTHAAIANSAVIERSGKFGFSKVRRPRINSEFLQLTVIEMPERCPGLLICAPSPKPRRDVVYQVPHGGMRGRIAMIRDKVGAHGAHGLADQGPHRHLTIGDRNALSLKPARHDALPIDDETPFLTT
jgi:hypothetical protein